MKDEKSLFDTITSIFVPVHPDGHKFIAAFAIASLILYWFSALLGLLGFILTVWCVYFFRDPARVTPLAEGLVVSPADGKVAAIEKVVPSQELDLGSEPRTRISIFLSVFDVHITRSPVTGKIVRSLYVPGLFLNAELDKASEENERQCLVLETPEGVRFGVVQIAGLVARRIVTFVSEGHSLGVGERLGLIRFGSRVDLYLPPGHESLVAVGQRAVGGETVFADLSSEDGARQARRD